MALAIDLPRKADGEVDWCTFGNILTGELLGQVHCASFLDPLYGPKQQGLIPQTSWEYEGIKHNIVILKRRVEGTNLESFMGRGVINFPVERVVQHADNMQQMHNWERYLADIRCIKQLSEDNSDAIVYRRYQTTACLVNVEADFIYYLRSKFHNERFVRSGASVGDIFYPPVPGVFRAKMLPGSGYVMEPYMGDPNRTLVTYMAAISIGGVPTIAVNKVMRDLSVSINYLNEYIKKIWARGPAVPQSPIDHIDAGHDQGLSNPGNDTGNSDTPVLNNQVESEAKLQTATMHSPSDIERKSEAFQNGRNSTERQKLLDHLYKDGEVDWNALGEEITSQILQEVESIATVDGKYGSATTVPQGTTDWRYVYEKHNVVVYTKNKGNSSVDCFLGRGVVDAPMKAVGDFISDIGLASLWDNTLVDAQYVKVIHKSSTHTDFITCLNYETTKCRFYAKRDNLCFVRTSSINGKYVLSGISVDHPECPPSPDTTRIKVYSGSGWVMEPYHGSETQTLVTYIAHVDLMGLPSVVTNYVLRGHPLAVHYIRLHIPYPPQDAATDHSYSNTAVGGVQPIALLSDIDQRLEKGWRVTGWS
eukprot:Em0019g1129a